MSFQAMTWAVEQELPAMQKIVLLMLANRTNHDTGLCFPSHDTLAKECGMSKRSMIDQIEKIERAGLIKVYRSSDERGLKSVNKYRLSINKKSTATDSLPTATDSLRGSATDAHEPVNSFNQSINQKDNQVITPPPENFVSPDECELTVEKMGGELQACFEWAKEHPYWNFLAKESISKFFYHYKKTGQNDLRAQFERRNDPRNTTGGNNGTRQQPARPAKVSAATKVEQAIAERDKHKREMATVIDGEFKYG